MKEIENSYRSIVHLGNETMILKCQKIVFEILVWLDADKLGHHGNDICEGFGAVLVEKFGKSGQK